MKKKNKKQLFDAEGNAVSQKPFYKRWWFIALAVLFVLYAIGSDTDTDTAEEPVEDDIELVEEADASEEEVVEEPAPEPEIVEVVEEEPEEEPEDEVDEIMTVRFMEDLVLEIMKDSFSGTATIHLNRETKTYEVTPLDENVGAGAFFAAAGDQDSLDGWNALLFSMQDISDSISEQVGTGYSVRLVNPSNHDNYLALIMDGIIIYDVVRDQ